MTEPIQPQGELEKRPEVLRYEQNEAAQIKRLMELYKMSEEKLEDDPLELQEKMTLFGEIYEIMGDLEALAVGQKELAYAYRQEVNAHKFLHAAKVKQGETVKKPTGDERKAYAELAVRPYRRNEARFAEESKKWKNRRDSVLEQINIMKRRQDLFVDQWEKANYINGYNGGN
jgi:hypothetical protein